MGVIYIVLPLNEEIAGYLRDYRVAFPDLRLASRNPTPQELRSVCAGLDDFKAECYSSQADSWQIMIEGRKDPGHEPWTLLNVSNFNGDELAPHEIWFEKGWPSVIVRILHGLAKTCGPLVIWPDTGDAPLVVCADVDFEILLDSWEHAK